MTELYDNGLVSYDKLQERLISTGKLDAGESVLMIEHIEKSGKIKKTGDYNIYGSRSEQKNGTICDNNTCFNGCFYRRCQNLFV